ncbi:MAG: hypothetical protein DRH04_01695 [Deltaproteobacteria bacterium]|nr:MAG: hypothetical protein DRH04_01695 [Deltaproteobacteria bacterium]
MIVPSCIFFHFHIKFCPNFMYRQVVGRGQYPKVQPTTFRHRWTAERQDPIDHAVFPLQKDITLGQAIQSDSVWRVPLGDVSIGTTKPGRLFITHHDPLINIVRYINTYFPMEGSRRNIKSE